MGLGGNLIWSAVLKNLHEAEAKPVLVAHKPLLSDLLCGRLHNRAVGLADDEVFRGNPRLIFTEPRPKGAFARLLDKSFAALVAPQPLKRAYELAVFALAERASRHRPHHLVHVDMLIHSYVERQRSDRMIWKQGGHAIDAVARRLTDRKPARDCELYFAAGEEAEVDRLLADNGLAGDFVAVDADTNRDWFGELRAWPFERWQEAIDRFRHARPELPVVQIGEAPARRLGGVVDLCGALSFRQAALIIRRSALFVGTESGPMHAANAVGANALILWGGVTLPEFAGYPDRHRVICKYVACAPCGQFGWCDNDHACMRSIAVDEVFAAMLEMAPGGESGRLRAPDRGR